MNLSLLDPFSVAQEYPEILTHSFEHGHSTCVSFNFKGDYLASGLLDGTIVIYDFDTYGIIVTLRGHARPIQSLSWSHDGRYLLSASRDWKCILWDLKTSRPIHTINMGAPVWGASLHPDNHLMFVASLYEDDAKLVNLATKKTSVVPSARSISNGSSQGGDTNSSVIDGQEDGSAGTATAAAAAANGSASAANGTTTTAKGPPKQLTLVTVFSKDGKHILCGTSRGMLNVVSTDTLEVVFSEKLTNSNIKNLRVSSSGRRLLVNSSDRIIRLIRLPDFSSPSSADNWELDIEHKFQDVVNRLQWNSVTMSNSGEYVLATTYESAHDIYMWETSMGSLVKIYEGPKEELVDIEFHPSKPAIISTGLDTGAIYLWSSVVPQKWSALAPDFVELEENIEYQEKEDEFDLIDQEEENKRLANEEEDEVDVFSLDAKYADRSFVIPMRLDTVDEV